MSAARTDDRARLAHEQMSSTERVLAESIERYRSLFAYVPHAAFSLDLQGRFTDANAVAQEVSGYTLEEFLRMGFTDLITPEDLGPAVEAFHGALHRAPQRLEATMRHKDGSVIELNVTAVPVVVHNEVVGVHGLAEDVTEQNELRRELERTRRAAEEANAAKSLFLANMSHEVRTPLTSVLGAAEILAEGDLGPGDRALVAIVQRSAEKLHRLVNDILDVSRLEAGKLDVQETVMSLQDVAAEAITWAGPMAHKEGLTFTWDLDPCLPTQVYGDAMRISQVLTNLLGNAMKFTERGEVRLRVEVREAHRSLGPGEVQRRGLRHRHPRGPAGLPLRVLHPGRHLHDAEVRRRRTRSGDLPGAGAPDGRHPHRAQHRGRRQHLLLHPADGARRTPLSSPYRHPNCLLPVPRSAEERSVRQHHVRASA